MTLCNRDLAFYYNKAEFKTFRKDSTLFLVMDVPITSDNFAHNFQLYDVIKLPSLRCMVTTACWLQI